MGDEIPVFVRGGSVLVMGPVVQYATEKKWDVLEVRVYGGADGEFVLFEDDFETRGTVESGQCTFIEFVYTEATKELAIGKREGVYEGMIKTRTFEVTLVSE